MDYEKFFKDVSEWIFECNAQAEKLGFFNQTFWDWSVKSLGELSEKYHHDELAIRQTKLLLDWLDDIWKDTQNGNNQS